MTANAPPRRPLLRYHGGEWRIAPWIIAHLPPHNVYVEPFGGAASVLLRKPRSYSEVLNDLDAEVVNLFRVVRTQPARLTREIIWTPFARDEFRLAYQRSDDPLERARRLLIRAWLGFGSTGATSPNATGFRSNVTRSHTTPAHDWRGFPPTIRAVAKRLRGVVLDNRPASRVLAQYDAPDVVFYCDPPYVTDTRSGDSRTSCYRHEMTDADHEALGAQLLEVRAMVVLSGYPSPLYERLFASWHRVERAALADGAARRVEVLWLNPAAWARLSREREPLMGGVA